MRARIGAVLLLHQAFQRQAIHCPAAGQLGFWSGELIEQLVLQGPGDAAGSG